MAGSTSGSDHERNKDVDKDDLGDGDAGESAALSDLDAAGNGVALVSPALAGLAFPFRFLFTAEQFGRASSYHFAWQFRFLFWPARLVGLILIIGTAVGWSSRPPMLGFWTGILHLFSGAVMLTYVQLLVWTSLRSFRKSRLHGLQMSVILRGDGLHIRSGKPGEVVEGGGAPPTRHVEWDRFTSAVLFPGGVVLYQTTGNFHWLPYSGMLPPARSISADTAEGSVSGFATGGDDSGTPGGGPAANPTQLLEDFLRLHVPKVFQMSL